MYLIILGYLGFNSESCNSMFICVHTKLVYEPKHCTIAKNCTTKSKIFGPKFNCVIMKLHKPVLTNYLSSHYLRTRLFT